MSVCVGRGANPTIEAISSAPRSLLQSFRQHSHRPRMRLTAGVLLSAPGTLNAVEERELVLRGLKIPAIENLGVTQVCSPSAQSGDFSSKRSPSPHNRSQDKFEAIDLTDNEITKLDNMPAMRRLQSLYLANNQINRVADALGPSLPRLETLVLTNNRISQLAEVESLASIQSLLMLSLLHNPVARKPNYRLYVVHRFPHLRVLDFEKVKRAERIAAAKFFSSKAGKALLEDVKKSRVPAPLAAVGGPPAGGPAVAQAPAASQFSPEQLAALQAAIASASSADEVDRIRASLEAGVLPEQAIVKLHGGDAAFALAAAVADAPVPLPVA
jgi:U2 small nuclear ribonucleoprotein A'